MINKTNAASRMIRSALLTVAFLAQAAYGQAPSLTFYVPFPEADALTALTAVENGGSGDTPVNPMITYISIAAIANGTIIYYDQWEDGYEQDHSYAAPLQSTTQIWGDGNPANGAPPGIANDLIKAGTVILLYNQVTTTSPLTIDYDARDKIVATRAISVTRTYWATTTSTLFAGCVETFDTSKWGTDYRSPIGQNIPDSADAQMFEYTALSLLARDDATKVWIDADNNGAFETTNTLNEGQTAFVSGVNVGGRVLSDKPVQVILFSGDVASNYESRDSSLLPMNLWSSNYYTPVSTPAGNGTRVWLYNPGAASITVSNSYRIGTGSLVNSATSVAAGSYAAVLLPNGAAARFFTTGSTPPVFYAYSTTDSDSATTTDNQSWDWSFTLIPERLLSPQILVGLGLGRDPLSATNPSENGNPVWVTTVGNRTTPVTVYIDYDGDNLGAYTDANGNKYDASTSLIELQQAKLYDPDGDQTAMLLYVLSTNVTLAAAWGQDTLTATAGAPGLDVGTSIPPVDVIDVSKDLAVFTDANGDGLLGPNDRAEYMIRIGNTSRAPVPADVIIKDVLSAGVSYVASSTAYRTSTNGSWTAVADNGSGTPFPLDGAGYRIYAAIPVNGEFDVRFFVDVASFSNLVAGQVSIINTGQVEAVVFDRKVTFRNEVDLHGSLGDRLWNDADGDGIQDAGEAGLNGVVVYLDANTNGVRDAGEPYDTTTGNGEYLLTGVFLVAGTHLVRVDPSTLPRTDYIRTYDLDGTGSPNAASVVLAGGQARADVDFGYQAPARLGDFVWLDTNGNGQQDGGETGLSNVVVRLYSTNNVVLATVTSTAAGAYVFTNLSAGSYFVGFTPPSGYLFTTSNVGSDASDSDPLSRTNRTASITLTGGQTNLTADAGFYLPASLSGFVRVDLNGNGIAEAGDTNGIANVTVQVLNANSNVVATTTTAASGSFSFTNLAPGTYTVREIDLVGWYSTTDVAAPNDNRIPVTLTSGQSSSGHIFHDTQRAALGNFVWLDANGNGQQDGGELGLSNIVARLYDTNSVILATVTSTVAGAYAFTNLTAGTYTVGFTPPPNYLFTTSNVGSDASDSDPLAGTNRTAAVTLASGQTDSTVDAGFYPAASLSGYVRADLNGNGTAEANDTNGIAGVTVQLLNAASNVVVTTTTAADGSYGFANLRPGAYTVRETDLGGWYSTADVSAPNDNLIPVTLAVGQSSAGNHFYDALRAAIGNFVWLDANGNGQQDGGELGLSNVVVRLYSTNSVVLATVTSAVSGAYAFTNLMAGTYTVGFSPPAGYLFTTSNVGSDASDSDPLAGTNRTSAVTLASGQTDNTVDAGFYLGASISGIVRVDLNGNGVAEAADTNGIAGATVQLLNAASNVVATTTTASDGAYSFTGLLPGVYMVRESDLTGWYSTTDSSAPNDNLIPVTLAIGQTSAGNIFHDTQRVAIGDFVWADANGNGQQDGGEPGLANAVVRLYDANSALLATVTSAVSGAYAFTNLAAGTYTVGFTPPASYRFTTSNVGSDATDSDPLTGTNRTSAVTLASGQTDSTLDAGFYLPASLSGFVRVDLNGNGVAEAGDTNGIAGVTVQLLDAALNVVAMSTTAAGGSYSFTGLFPGAYTVREMDLGGWYSTTDFSAPNDNLIPVTLASGQASAGNTFHDTQRAAIGNFVWLDVNGNGQQDGGELGLSNVVVSLYATNGVILATATSTVAGAYAFTGLEAGTYTVGFAPPTSYLFTTSNVGGDASDSDPLAGTNRTAAVTLASGQTDNSADAGFIPAASLAGLVRIDVNGNGSVEGGDTNGLANVTVQLLNASSNVVATTTTAADGSYRFANLYPGAYTVRETDLSGWYSTTDIVAPNDNLIPLTLAVGQASLGNNFHDTQRAALGDYVWVDSNGNGQQDGGEPGLSGVVVRLYGTNTVVLATATSTVSGAYAFTNLAAGTYALGFTPPAGYLFTAPNMGSDATDSDPLAGTNRTASVTLASGQTDNSADAGFYLPASLSGSVRVDADGNGVVDAEDTLGLANVTVRLLDAALNVVATTTTSGTGAYSFSNLTPGSYTAAQTLPSGYTNTVDVAAPNDLLIPRTLTSGQNSNGNDFYDTLSLAGLRNKVLYLSDPGLALDRIDPVAAVDNTTAQSILLSNSVSSGYATIGVANVTTGVTTDVTSLTPITCVVRHTVPAAGADRLLIVGVSINMSAAGGTDGRITGVTYGSTNLVGIGGVTNDDQVVSMYALLNPPVGTTNVVVTYATAPNQYSVVGVASLTNVNQTTPYGAFYSSGGATGNPTLTLTSATGELVLDTVSLQSSVLSGVGAGQTRRWSRQSPDNGGTANGGGSTKAGAANVTMTWTSTGGTTPWALGAVSLKPAPLTGVGNSTTFTQTPAFASPFVVPAGALIRLTNYVAVVSGSMPTNPAIVATLSYGGSPFLTFSNPVYRAASSSLAWRAVVPATVTVPAGQTLALTVVSAQTGTTFRVNFDSAAFPSKIVLPTTTVIDVPSLGIYDGAYPGGSSVTNSPITSLRYVRVTVTDPFGAYDVTGVDLAIDGPGTGSDASVPLGQAQVVASNAVSKTYEYGGQSPSTLGSYVLTVTAHEGSEGIVATATTTQTLVPMITSVGDFVWVDTNGNGQQDGGEPGLSNAVIRLYDSNSVVIATTTSTVSGAYFFTGMPVGSYSVGFTPPLGYLFTTSNVGNDATDNDPLVGTNRTAEVALIGSQTNLTIDAGFYLPASLAGFVRDDDNGNGVAEAADTNGIAGVTMQLLNSASNVVATTTTAADGSYRFSGLFPGAYIVREIDLGSWHSTADISAPNDNLIPVSLTSGQVSSGNNFLDSKQAAIGDFVWLDANGNGQQDGVEPGLSNVVVRLYNTNSVVLATVTSTVSGAYAFTGLSAGHYTIGFTPPAGYLFTTSNVGSDASDSDPLAGTNRTAVVTVGSGDNDNTVDAGFIPGASLSGFVRVDVNGNGVAETGDTNGIVGVTVQLLNAASSVIATATTAADGSYVFSNLYPGVYTVRELDLGGWYSTTDSAGANDNLIPVALALGQASTGNTFHDTQRAALGDYAWVDTNGNGQQDGGEPGLANVVVRLYTTNDIVLATATSTVSGAYAFTNLAAGSYTVGFTPPAGFFLTSANMGSDAGDSDPLAGTNRTATVTLTSGQTDSTVDVGFYQPAAIGDFVWADANGNGQQDGGETGVGGVTVTLFRPGYGPDGLPGTADDADSVATTTSGAGGAYSFTNLQPGTYQAGFGTAAGYYRTAADQGSDATDSDANVGTGLTAAFAVTSGQTVATIDAGYQAVTVGDFVWTDANANGVQEAGEPGLAGVQVQVYTAAGDPYQLRTALGTIADDFDPSGGLTGSDGSLAWATDWTAANGATVVVNTGTDYEIRIADAANSTLTRSFTAPAGTDRLTISFDYRSGAGNDTVAAQWSDNGTSWTTLASYNTSSGGTGSTNFTVSTTAGTRYVRFTKTARGNLGGGSEFMYFDNVSILAESALTAVTATTDAYGYFFLDATAGLVSGTNYQLRVATNQTSLAGLALTGQNLGGNDAMDSDATLATASGFSTLAFTAPAAGGSDQTLDFGFKGTASVGNFVWNDANGNGQQDAGAETNGLAGVTVRLYDTTGAVIGLVTSSVSGAYAFTDLMAGSYTVGFAAPAGYLFTTSNVGSDATDSDPLTGTNRTATVTLSSGQTDTTVDAGFYATASIAGFVRVDQNGNGVAEAGDTNGIASVTVQLLDAASNVVATADTAADGSYSFTGLRPGAYAVRETDLSGWYSTTDSMGANDNRIPVTLSIGQNSSGNNFHDTRFAALGNFVWLDADGNGQQDSGAETNGLSGVVVRLYDINGAVVGTATSTVAGAYAFTNLAAGSYTVGFAAPAGYLFTTSNVGSAATDSNPLTGTNRTAAVTLSSGQTDTTVDAGFYAAASVTGFVRVDLNGNGVAEEDDTDGIASVTVRLLDAASNVVATAVTAADGSYSFTNLRPGAYTVRETDLGGWYSTTDVSAPNDNLIPVALSIGQNAAGNNFHDTRRAALGDFVWIDADGNGQQDGGEAGLSGVVVSLYDANGAVAGTATSTVSGAYAFTNLAAGSYTVGFAAPAGYLFTGSNIGSSDTDSDPLEGTNRTAAVTLASGQTDSTVDAGFYAAASVSGFVRVDLNGNGAVEAGDTNGIAGVTVRLLDAASSVVATAATAADGSYGFTGLRPGDYTVSATDLVGWYSTTDVSAPNDNLIPIALSIGQNSSGNNFHDTRRAALGDFVWLDADGDGQQDGGEAGLSGVVVSLYDANGAVAGTATSTVSGAYAFTNLAAGSYTVGFATPAGYLFTTSNVGNDATDSDPLAGTNRTAAVTLSSGQTDTTVDAGFYAAASVTGFVRVDLNGNGVAEAGDTNGIAGVTVQLLDAASNVLATAATAADGAYSFTNLHPGSYTVRETDLGGWYSTTDIVGANDNLIPVTLSIGQTSAGNTFHDTRRSALGDFVWIDADGDGQQDGGEAGLAGVVVYLYDTNRVVAGVATSTVSGAYAFTNLEAGSYTVGFAAPAGYLFTTSNVGNDAADSDPLAGTNRTAAVTLSSGQTDTTVDAGFYAAASISGFVRVDVNGNGTVEAGDTNGIAGVTVRLLDAVSNVVATAVTAADGSYSFTNLRPGSYTVRETDLGGWYSTTDIVGANDNLIPVALSIGQTSAGNTFHDTRRAALGDFVWLDADGDGQQDGGEAGLSGVVVSLYDANGAVVGVATSTVAGVYAFTNLAAGSYTVGFSAPAGYLFTTSNVGSAATDSDPLAGTNRTAAVTLSSGQTDSTVDAGFYAAASVSGFVRVDLNGNGAVEAGDTNGIAGVTVRLLDAASNVVATAVTAADGSYSFTNLRPGSYTVRETDLGGWYSTTDIVGANDNMIPVTLSIGQTSAGNTFHDTRRSALGDFVWFDADGDGQQDGGEAGLAGVVVSLYDANDTVVGVATSTEEGAYAFTNLAAGSYTVGFAAPAGLIFTISKFGSAATDSDPFADTNRTAAVTLASGQTDTTVDAGFYAAASVSGFVRVDLNGNGVAEEDDTGGIAGVTVQLLGADSGVLATTTTAVDGSYGFTGLRPGAYTVRETDLGGWYSTMDVSAPNDNLIPVTLSVGQTSADNNFHDTRRAALGDFVWLDADGNGQQDGGETGLVGVVVSLYDANGAVAGMATSTVAGAYAFTNLAAGSYTVGFAVPAGFIFTLSSIGSAATDSDPLAGTNRTAAVTLASGQTDTTVDAGFYAAASVSGFVRVDLNGNGAVEAGDTNGIAGVTVQLLDADSNVLATTTTAADGSYGFTDLRPGAYTVRETDLGGWYSTADVSAPNDNLVSVTLSIGQTSTENNFHDTQLAAFGDRVWNDLDGDGAQDAFEPGIANVRVYADSDGSGTCDAGEPSATTAADGSYLIGELATGSYTARVDSATLPAGMLQTYDLNGALDHQAAAALTSGQTRADVDFGYRAIAVYTISGQVRDDYDQSGNLNKPDKPVGGVKVTLFSDPNGDGDPSDGMVVTKGRTDADGRYTFTNVPSGAYVVVETDPTHSYSTGDRVGDNDNRIPVVIVDADSVENDFLDAVDPAGYFYDVADGRIVPGGRIEVSGAGALVLMDGSSGQYMFISTNPSPSTFTITVTPPPGYIIDPTRPALPGAFDPTGGPDPTVLGSYENEGHPGYLADFSAASNTYYYSFTLEPGDPPVINSNFPLTPVVIEIAGTVFHDANRLSDGLVNGSGTNAAGLFANLVDPATHGVLAGVAVAEDGAYRFGEADGVVTNTAYEVILTRTPQTVGETLTSATLPAAWVSTGEHVGAGAGSDGTVDGRLLASTTADGVREVNFGLDRVPDITPVITAVPNVMHAVQNFFITVRATELNLVDTFGLITIRIPKDIRWVFDGPYDPSLTVLGSTALNNAVWEHSEDSTHHIFKSTEVIPAGGYSYFGFRAVWDAGQTRGRYTITSQIDSWSGGEDRIDNNVDAERLDYFIN